MKHDIYYIYWKKNRFWEVILSEHNFLGCNHPKQKNPTGNWEKDRNKGGTKSGHCKQNPSEGNFVPTPRGKLGKMTPRIKKSVYTTSTGQSLRPVWWEQALVINSQDILALCEWLMVFWQPQADLQQKQMVANGSESVGTGVR